MNSATTVMKSTRYSHNDDAVPVNSGLKQEVLTNLEAILMEAVRTKPWQAGTGGSDTLKVKVGGSWLSGVRG